MRRLGSAILAGIAVLTLTIGLAYAAIRWIVPWWLERPPSVSSGTTLVLRVSGTIAERDPLHIPILEDPPPWTTWRLLETFRKASADKRISALLLMPEGVGAGWTQLAEVRSAIDAFAKTGKPVTAYLRSPGSRDYYLASVAGRIAGPPGDLLNIKGFRAELLYARGLLDKLGIVPEFESMGRYKDGADPLTRTAMRPETREVIESIVQARYDDWSATVAAGRKKTSAEVKRLIDEGPFLADAAHTNGLTDAVEFEDQTRAELAKRIGQKELTTLAATEYQRISDASLGLEGRQRIAIVMAEGDMVRDKRLTAITTVLDPAEFNATLKEVREDKDIRAVVLRIDSPGGDAIASEEMTHQVRLLAEKKPVIVSMGDVAASAGYQIAAPAHVICADPRTVTGSIGVFFGKLALAGLYSKLGINKEMITRGRYAAIDSDTQPLTPQERAKLHSTILIFYQKFVAEVAAARRRTPEQIDQVAQGRVWLGTEAARNGLVDELAGLKRAIEIAQQRANIPTGDGVQIEVYPKQPSLVETIRQRTAAFQLMTSGVQENTVIWKRLPFAIDVR